MGIRSKGWPDILVAVIIGLLALKAATSVIAQSLAELSDKAAMVRQAGSISQGLRG